MTLVENAPSDDLRLIVHHEFDRRAPFDAATNIRACGRAVARAVAGWRDLFGDASGGDVSITAGPSSAAGGRHCARPRSAHCPGDV